MSKSIKNTETTVATALDTALEAALKAEPRTRAGGKSAGEFQTLVLAMLNKAGVLTLNQIKAGLDAVGFVDGHGNPATPKFIADRVWTYAKKGKCAFGDVSGQYMSVAYRAEHPKA